MNAMRFKIGAASRGRAALVACTLALGSCYYAPRDRGYATPQRPTVASDVNVAELGTAELEVGVRSDPGDEIEAPIALRFGVAPKTELYLAGAPWFEDLRPGANEGGITDPVVGMRQRLWEEEGSIPAFAYQLAAKLPIGADRTSTGEIDLFAAAIAQRTVGDVTLLGFYELGFEGEVGSDGVDARHTIALDAA